MGSCGITARCRGIAFLTYTAPSKPISGCNQHQPSEAIRPMKPYLLALALLLSTSAFAQDQKKAAPTTLRGILLEQLRTTHDNNDWFVAPSNAVDGVTAEQA